MYHTRRMRLGSLVCVLYLLGHTPPIYAQKQLDFTAARRRMINEEIIAAGVTDERVTEAIMQTPRHEFVAPNYRRLAYVDMALPIGGEQTISSPFIVAYMTELLDPQLTDRVLEIGTGSGYQAAVLSPLVEEVYTAESLVTGKIHVID